MTSALPLITSSRGSHTEVNNEDWTGLKRDKREQKAHAGVCQLVESHSEQEQATSSPSCNLRVEQTNYSHLTAKSLDYFQF